ncbi:hypothetical protein P1X15_09725 [Runella sp. MFBS21]|uniref:DUF6787 family protein n=1 Tax=Runella sp. MFBS21 TaxID=3034018 RepID=UPI0023F7092B|nr:DUF6787 family protein [Runella sp. MFBS21]MDF7817877.1 hypothetical protein [Runella sp. MFBS21]
MQTSDQTHWLARLQNKWGLKNTWQVIAVLLTFTFAGSSVVWFRKGLFYLLGYDETTPFWLKTVTYLIFIFPTYQTLLLLYGFLFGQFSFFWEKEKKMIAWIKNKINGKKAVIEEKA